MYTVMLVDDDDHILRALRRLLILTPCVYEGGEYAFEVVGFTSPKAALDHARAHPIDAVLSDYRMAELDGVAFLKAFREIQPDAARLILSGHADLHALMGAINEAQVFRYLSKPWNDIELVTSLAEALASRNVHLENRRLAEQARQRVPERHPQDAGPDMTEVNWGPDGSVIVEDLGSFETVEQITDFNLDRLKR